MYRSFSEWIKCNAIAILIAMLSSATVSLGWAYRVGVVQEAFLTKREANDVYLRKDIASIQYLALYDKLKDISAMQERNSVKLDDIDQSFRESVINKKL